jgi:hypothetical protein
MPKGATDYDEVEEKCWGKLKVSTSAIDGGHREDKPKAYR